jgi:hypothetical protein
VGSKPALADEKGIGPATTLYGTVALSFVIPPAPACRGTGAKRSGGTCGAPRPLSNSKGLSKPPPLPSRELVTSSLFSCFLHIPNKAVILSEALHRSIANRGLYGAESKDPGDAYWQMLLRAFRPQTTTEDRKVTTPSVAEGSAVSLTPHKCSGNPLFTPTGSRLGPILTHRPVHNRIQ